MIHSVWFNLFNSNPIFWLNLYFGSDSCDLNNGLIRIWLVVCIELDFRLSKIIKFKYYLFHIIYCQIYLDFFF